MTDLSETPKDRPTLSINPKAARGRGATSPTEIPVKGWRDIALRVKDEMARDHVSVVAAGVAFFGLLALFPAIVAVISVAALLLEPSQISTQLDAALAALPTGAAEIIAGQIETVLEGDREAGWTFVLGLVLAVYAAAKGMKSLIEGMNIAYDEEETRGFLHLNALAIGLTLLVAAGVILGIAAAVVVPIVLETVGLGETANTILSLARWPVLLLFTLAGLAVIYRLGPDRDDARWRWLTPGATLAAILWVAGSFAFTIYVESFGSYNETYGSIGAVIVLLTWLWMSALIVMLGAEINSEMEHQTRRDTTTGPREPMGVRGAEKADNLGEVP
ncbi:YihY/virulence factor BrkB family protein [Hasllibacter sp. MH4015]|uniref:YihY/virulence factor BrkB family protein n=1 Tax=Hasllibacter sp. MH4015 TaxID=2854029 RepID=UPI001CD26C17|nr:YihY/virulence factor BrkB family protein [Hasllibacter sp. MH4015]